MSGFATPAKSKKIRLVENTVERTARMLSREYGIRVVWEGSDAKTDGKTIYLPALPDDAPDELLEAVQGYLDHETAHIIFTDFQAISSYKPKPTPEQFFCINLVEDVRIEDAMGKLFPGSPYNLRLVHEWLQTRIAENWSEINQFKRACVGYFYYTKYGDSDFYNQVVDDDTKELIKKCETAVGSYDQINTTFDAIEAGLRMYEVLKEEAKEEQKEREQREKQQQNAGQNAKGSAGGSQQQIGKNGKPIITSIGELAEEISKEATVLIAKYEKSVQKGYSGYQHGQEAQGYLVYSTAGDTIMSMPDGDLSLNGQNLLRLRDEAREITSVIRTRLVNSLRAQARRRWVGGKEEGKIDSRRLHHALLGTSNNVYKVLTDKQHLNTVVGMAIDHSGSMVGRKLELAGESAIVIGDALNTLRIPFMVYGYSTEAPNQMPPDTAPYARWGKLWIRYYRDFDESWEKGAVRLAGAKQHCMNNTLDAESVKHGIRRLLTRPEKRKILFVLNDGMPYPGYGHVGRCQQHLHDVVASAKAAGVEVVAFGIQADDVKRYYPNNVVIRDLKDLVAEPLQLLDKMLRGGMTLK